MGDLNKNFNRSEFECKCGCGQNVIDYEIIIVFTWLEDELIRLLMVEDVYIVIKSGNRCQYWNGHEKGSFDSTHPHSIAADYKIFITETGKQVSPVLINDTLDKNYPDKYGLGVYHNRNHLDVRENKARWKG